MALLLLFLCAALSYSAVVSAQTDTLSLPLPQLNDSVVVQQPTDSVTENHRPFTTLSGTLPSQLKKEQSPFIVEADIFVTPGSNVSIEDGVVILFNNFTGLHIQGTLFIKGTSEYPVVFTSVNDQTYNPDAQVSAAPYDWNGIDVYESAIGTQFEHCIIQYSVYGIRSLTNQLKITRTRFLQNGKSNLSIQDSTFTIDTMSFSYRQPAPVQTVTITDSSLLPEIQQPSLGTPPPEQSKKSRLRGILRYSGLVLAAVGIAAVAQEYDELRKAQSEFDRIDTQSDYNKQALTSTDWEIAHDQLRKETLISGAYAVSGMTGLVLFGLSFTF